MDPGSGDLGETVYSGIPGKTVGMATMVDMSEASKPKSGKKLTPKPLSEIEADGLGVSFFGLYPQLCEFGGSCVPAFSDFILSFAD